ncbi:MAG: hypothetical protein IRY94_20365 [Rhodospirillaceae bacterium]|nr:hypothetical protein [Rhodospirillaceae bacterium]
MTGLTLAAFKASLAADAPPEGVDAALAALWWAAKGEWDRAHALAQSQGDARGAWVHAHLHRIEGDEANAGYWYRRAGRPHAAAPLPAEWEAIAAGLLGRP